MSEGGGSSKRRSRAEKKRKRRLSRATRAPLFGLAVVTPLVFAGAVSATPRLLNAAPLSEVAVAPLAAVAPIPEEGADVNAGPAVVAVARTPGTVRIAVESELAPPPSSAVYSRGMLGIPARALSAYRNAEVKMATSSPECGVSWNLLAGIGRIESMHANGGATDTRGNALHPIYGPVLDGSLPGNEIIVQSSGPGGRVTYARAMGPMQFLPGTWSRYAADGDGDGKADPQNLYDASLAAARYLCSGGLNLRDERQALAAILRYNNSMPYAQNVLGWAAAYATGSLPEDLPTIVGPAPPLADMHLEHLEHPEGLGPNAYSVHGLTGSGGAQTPLIQLAQQPADPRLAQFPWLAPWLTSSVQQQQTPPVANPKPVAACGMICLDPQPNRPMPVGRSPQALPPQASPQQQFGLPQFGLPQLAPPQFGPPALLPAQAGPPAPMPPQFGPPAPMAPQAGPPAPMPPQFGPPQFGPPQFGPPAPMPPQAGPPPPAPMPPQAGPPQFGPPAPMPPQAGPPPPAPMPPQAGPPAPPAPMPAQAPPPAPGA